MANMVETPGQNPVGAALANPAMQQAPTAIPAYQRPAAPMQAAPAQTTMHAPAPYIPQQPQQAQYQPAPQQQQGQPSWQDMMRFMQQMQGQGNQPGAPQNYGPPGQPQPMQQGFHQRMQQQQANPMLGVRPAPSMNPVQPGMMPRVQSPYIGGGAPSPMGQNPFQAGGAPAAMGHPQYANPTGTTGQAPAGNAAMAAGNHGADPTGTLAHGGAGMGGMATAMSDETQKVVNNRTLADDFLEHMRPYSYKYKDPSMEPRVSPTGGDYLGVMAQDLERIPHLGPQIVVDTPNGKMVDQKTALSASMAGLARVNEKVMALQSDLGKGHK